MPLFEVQFAFTVEAATPSAAEELVDEACHFDHEEPAWLQISSIIANVYELAPKKKPTIDTHEERSTK